MQARDHLRLLQQRYPLGPIKLSDSLRTLAISQGIDPDQPPEPSDCIADHLVTLLPSFPKELKALYDNERLAAGLIGSDSVHAYRKKLGKSTHVIIVHLGFTRLIYYFCRAIAPLVNSTGKSKVSESLIEKAALDIAEIAWWHRLTDKAYRPGSEPTPSHIQIAYDLSIIADAFYTAHEVGHVWIDLVGRDNAIRILPEPSTLIISWREEHLADGFAMLSLLRAIEDGQYPAQRFGIAGAELVIHAFAILETLGFALARSHPPAAERLHYLQEVVQSASSSGQSRMVDTIGKVFACVETLFHQDILPTEEENRDIESLVEWFDEVFVALPLLNYESLLPLAMMKFGSVRPDHLLAASARAVLRSIFDPAERIGENPEMQRRLAATCTDEEIRRLVHRQEILIDFVRTFATGNLRKAFLRALAGALDDQRTPPDGFR